MRFQVLKATSMNSTWRWLSSGMLRHVVCYIFIDVSELLTAYQTARRNIPEDNLLQVLFLE
jgi:hypothetical protein